MGQGTLYKRKVWARMWVKEEVLGRTLGLRKRDQVEEKLRETKKVVVARLDGQEYEGGKSELRDMAQRGALRPRMSDEVG